MSAAHGPLIVMEGLDGSGKATQTAMLLAYLKKCGVAARPISFPDYGEPSAALVKLYLSGALGGVDEVNAYAASSFFAVDRYASYRAHWREAYLSGELILADRYATSNIPHQMSKLPPAEWDAFIDWVEEYEYDRLELPRPDLVLYLDMPPAVSRALLSARYHGDESKKDIHEANAAYLEACRAAALYGAKRLGWRVIACAQGDAPRSVEEIAAEIQAQYIMYTEDLC